MAENPETRESEQDGVLRRRFDEALEAGLNPYEAYRFAVSDLDVGLLRLVVKKGCPAQLIARIVL